MIEKLTNIEKLNREELYAAIYELYDTAKTIKIYRHLQDYSGNFDEIFNAYSVLNLKQVEEFLIDNFMDNVDIENANKKVEQIYFVDEPVSTYLKCEALKVVVKNELHQTTLKTNINAGCDFIIFDDGACLILDFTPEGALIGGALTTNKSDVKLMNSEYERIKIKASDYLKFVAAEDSTKRNVVKRIMQIKEQLHLK